MYAIRSYYDVQAERIARANSRDDWVCQFADDLADNGTAELCSYNFV